MRVLKPALTYFALAFGAGFVLGTARTLWVAPRLGARTAELLEAPIMLAVTVLATRWTVRRYCLPASVPARLGVGLLALVILLAVEFTVVLWLRGLTLAEYIAGRDPVAGMVYVALLVLFATMPLFVRR